MSLFAALESDKDNYENEILRFLLVLFAKLASMESKNETITSPSNEVQKKTKSKKSSLVYQMCLVAIGTALMAALSPISIPLEPVSITLATLVVYLLGAVLPLKLASFPILIYLILGFVGLPVFSKFQGGAQVILGPTGGFLMGYLPCILLESLLITLFPSKKWMYPVAMLAGTVVLYAFGVLWFVLYGGNSFIKGLTFCVLPFLPLDSFRIFIASLCGIRLRPLVDKKLASR